MKKCMIKKREILSSACTSTLKSLSLKSNKKMSLPISNQLNFKTKSLTKKLCSKNSMTKMTKSLKKENSLSKTFSKGKSSKRPFSPFKKQGTTTTCYKRNFPITLSNIQISPIKTRCLINISKFRQIFCRISLMVITAWFSTIRTSVEWMNGSNGIWEQLLQRSTASKTICKSLRSMIITISMKSILSSSGIRLSMSSILTLSQWKST